MHPRYEELSGHLDHQRAELRAAVASVPTQYHATPPGVGEWSVLEVLEHLVIVEGRIGKLLEKNIGDAKIAGVQAETDDAPLLPLLNIAVFTDRTRKIKGSDAVAPKSGPQLPELWESLEETLATIRRVLAEADGMRLTEVMMPHPVFGPLDLYTWFAFVGSHEARHAAQIREIGARVASGRA